VHDDIADFFVMLLKNAGFVDVEYEDVWWDADAAYDDSEHRRPDIQKILDRICAAKL
jgi:hypothetical protein